MQLSVRKATAEHSSLSICGGGSKSFYGRDTRGDCLDVSGHAGVLSYEPTELVLTARCGTPLSVIESVLAEKKQMLGFEPPYFGKSATIGGAVACGLSGPRRPFSGSVRDFILGCQIINGQAEILSFGGQVMKNVAGYDVSRLMVGAMGTLGLLLQVSVKVLPQPETELSLRMEMSEIEALQSMNRWATKPFPLSALVWDDNCVHIRLSGGSAAVLSAVKRLGGERVENSDEYWVALREHTLPFFETKENLWRLSVAPASPRINLGGSWFYDWGGAQRWLVSDESPDSVYKLAASMGGHATLFRSGNRNGDRFQPLSAPLAKLNRNMKQAFDPHGIFNPFRLYKEW